jgi:hypothetical protein
MAAQKASTSKDRLPLAGLAVPTTTTHHRWSTTNWSSQCPDRDNDRLGAYMPGRPRQGVAVLLSPFFFWVCPPTHQRRRPETPRRRAGGLSPRSIGEELAACLGVADGIARHRPIRAPGALRRPRMCQEKRFEQAPPKEATAFLFGRAASTKGRRRVNSPTVLTNEPCEGLEAGARFEGTCGSESGVSAVKGGHGSPSSRSNLDPNA